MDLPDIAWPFVHFDSPNVFYHIEIIASFPKSKIIRSSNSAALAQSFKGLGQRKGERQRKRERVFVPNIRVENHVVI